MCPFVLNSVLWNPVLLTKLSVIPQVLILTKALHLEIKSISRIWVDFSKHDSLPFLELKVLCYILIGN